MRKGLIFVLLVAAFTACKKEHTTWNSDWSFPLVNDTLSLANLVNDSTFSETGGIYHLNLKRTLFNVSINDIVKIPDTLIDDSYAITFPFITLTPGMEFINEQNEFTLDMQGAEIKTVVIKKGLVDLTIANPAATNAYFNVVLPDASKDGVVFDETYWVDSAQAGVEGVFTKTIDLSGYLLNLTGITGSERNTLLTEVSITSDPNGPIVTLTNGDIIDFTMDMKGIEVEYAKGYFGNIILSDTTSLYAEALDIVESGLIDVPGSTVKFEIENGIKVAGQVLLSSVKNVNYLNNEVALNHSQIGTPFVINPATGSWGTLTPSLREVEFNDGNSNIEQFLENMGSTFDVGYEIQLNPWGNASSGNDEIYPSSRFVVNLYADLPLTIGMDQLVLRDTFPLDLTQDQSGTHVTKGELLLYASNAFPFSADVDLILTDGNYNVLHTVSGSSLIQSGQFGALNSNNLMVSNSEVSFVLGEEIVNDIDKIKYVIARAKFNTINPSTSISEPMDVPVGAFLSLKLRSRLTTENHF